MKRLLLISAGVLAAGSVAAAPGVAGLTHNPSFSHQIPIRVPSQVHLPQLVDDHGADITAPTSTNRTSRSAEPGDDRGSSPRKAEPGDDRGSSPRKAEPGDDRGSSPRKADPGDDRGSSGSSGESGSGGSGSDDNGGHGGSRSGSDDGGSHG